MLFRKKQQNVQPQQEEQAPQQSKSFFARQVEKVKNTTSQIVQKNQQKIAKFCKLQLIFSVLSTLFFIGNSLFWVFKKWGDFGNLLWVMLAVTVGYILVFVVTLTKHRQDGAQMATDTKRFKIHLNIWKSLADVLFLVLSALMLWQNLLVWRAEGGLFTLVSIFVSGALLVIKFFATLIKLITLNSKRRKLNKNEQKRKQKQQQLQQSNEK